MVSLLITMNPTLYTSAIQRQWQELFVISSALGSLSDAYCVPTALNVMCYGVTNTAPEAVDLERQLALTMPYFLAPNGSGVPCGSTMTLAVPGSSDTFACSGTVTGPFGAVLSQLCC